MGTANADLILAGVAAGGTSGLELMWVAPLGTTLPTDADSALDAAFESIGYVTADGATLGSSRSTNDVEVYGSITPARKLVSKSSKTWEITGAETSPTVLEIYNQVELGTIVPDAEGKFSIAPSSLTVARYAFVLVVVDGENVIRFAAGNAEVTDVKERKIANGSPITYGMTITPYPDAAGVPVHEHYLVPALAGS
jgi:hypothetical protein